MENRKILGTVMMLVSALILTLVSCTVATPTPETANEGLAALNTIPVSRVTASSTPLPATPDPTPTEEMTPTPTIQPTVTETPVGISEPPNGNIRQQVLWLYETNNGCRLPCWWGITPGQTEWQTAQEFLNEFDFDIYELDSDSESVHYGIIIPLPIEVFFTDEWALGIIARNGIVKHIFTDVANGNPPQGTLTRYALSSFLTTYGAPSEVWLFTYFSPYVGDDLPFVATLFYAEQGIAALYSINGERQGEIVQGCIQDEPVSFLSLWSPDLDLTFEQVINGTSALEWDYLSLEESTEMSVTTFYETFKNPENTTCLETPYELWR
jgi:hypothetical protein